MEESNHKTLRFFGNYVHPKKPIDLPYPCAYNGAAFAGSGLNI